MCAWELKSIGKLLTCLFVSPGTWAKKVDSIIILYSHPQKVGCVLVVVQAFVWLVECTAVCFESWALLYYAFVALCSAVLRYVCHYAMLLRSKPPSAEHLYNKN